jgi:hypothetical protein
MGQHEQDSCAVLTVSSSCSTPEPVIIGGMTCVVAVAVTNERTRMTKAMIASVCALAMGLFGFTPSAHAVCTWGPGSNFASGSGSFTTGYVVCAQGGVTARAWIDSGCSLGSGCRQAHVRRDGTNCSINSGVKLNLQAHQFNNSTGAQSWRLAIAGSGNSCSSQVNDVTFGSWFITSAWCGVGTGGC